MKLINWNEMTWMYCLELPDWNELTKMNADWSGLTGINWLELIYMERLIPMDWLEIMDRNELNTMDYLKSVNEIDWMESTN